MTAGFLGDFTNSTSGLALRFCKGLGQLSECPHESALNWRPADYYNYHQSAQETLSC